MPLNSGLSSASSYRLMEEAPSLFIFILLTKCYKYYKADSFVRCPEVQPMAVVLGSCGIVSYEYEYEYEGYGLMLHLGE